MRERDREIEIERERERERESAERRKVGGREGGERGERDM